MPSLLAHRPDLEHAFGGARVCVTGGAGFIGGHLAEALLALDADVRVIDDLSGSDGSHVRSLVERFPDRCEFIYASILDDAATASAVAGCRCVFHLGAMGSVPQSVRLPERCMEVNVLGTLRVLEAAREAGVQRVVYSASSSAYGDSEELPKVESMAPNPLSPYAASKLAGEHLMRAWSESYDIDCVSLRYFNIFGPRQSADSAYAAVIAAFATALLSGRPCVVHGDGRQTRDFTFVDNAVLANVLGALHEHPLRGAVFNIGSGQRISILELHERLASMSGRDVGTPDMEPERPGDVRHSLADITRARDVLGYDVVTPLDDGLEQTMGWYSGRLGRSAGDLVTR